MPEQFGEKQHEATPHRREQARKEGQVAKSQDLSSAVVLLGALGILYMYGEQFFGFLHAFTLLQFENEAWISTDTDTLVSFCHGLVGQVTQILSPILGLIFLLAVVAQLSQVGLLFLPNKVGFDLTRIDPLRGLQRLFSLTSAVRLGFGIVKLTIVGTVAGIAVWNERAQVMSLSALSAVEIWDYLVNLVLWTSVKIAVALLVLAIIDYAYQRWKQEQDMRMTTQEMREEIKQTQGDPQVAARRKAVQRQLVLNRLNTTVPKADVIVTNPTELSIAIQYDHNTMAAPVVVAKGAGVMAQRIRRLGLENGVPILERKELARALYKQVEVGKPIPAEQYAAMAEVLRYVYELQGKSLPELKSAA